MIAMIFELWRQDDNGNRFLVGTFNDQAAADHRLDELTHCQHKQIYWIRAFTRSDDVNGETAS